MCNDHIAISHLWMGEGRGEEGGGGRRGRAVGEERHMVYMQCGSAQRGWYHDFNISAACAHFSLASYPGPHAERGRGPGDTWQNSHMCSVSIIA